jgi:phage tail-like protein
MSGSAIYQPAPPSSNGSDSRPAPPEKPRGKDSHIGLRFWIQLGQVEIAGFKECSPLIVETEMFEYPEGGLNTYTHKLPVRTKYSNITLKRGIDEGQDLYQWYVKVVQGQIKRQNISIIVYDSTGKEVRKWDLQNAYPCKWTGPDLKTDAGAIAVESLEIAHEGLLPTSMPSASPNG